MAKVKHAGNNAGMVVIAAFWAIVVLGMAWQTWGFIDWLLPGNAWLMKILVLSMFDIAAFIWFCLRNFYGKITRGAYGLATWGSILDGILSGLTTVFWFVIQYILKFNVAFQDGLITAMYIVGIIAFIGNALFAYLFVEFEWRFYHPVVFVDEDNEEEETVYSAPQKPIIRELKPTNKPAQLVQTSTNKKYSAPVAVEEVTTDTEDELPSEEPNNSKKKLPGREFLGGGKAMTK
jgi:hypothetical protein